MVVSMITIAYVNKVSSKQCKSVVRFQEVPDGSVDEANIHLIHCQCRTTPEQQTEWACLLYKDDI